jgi:hypothetical protein
MTYQLIPLKMRETLALNAQGIFNHVARHLLLQRTPAIGSSGLCVMRAKTEAGCTACAIGSLIPDSIFKKQPSLATSSIQDLMVKVQSRDLRRWLKRHQALLYSLAAVHDGVPVGLWAEKLKERAKHHGLQAGVVWNMCWITGEKCE